jgi:hypothetical protein
MFPILELVTSLIKYTKALKFFQHRKNLKHSTSKDFDYKQMCTLEHSSVENESFPLTYIKTLQCVLLPNSHRKKYSMNLEKPLGKRQFGRHRRRWKDNIKIDTGEICCEYVN